MAETVTVPGEHAYERETLPDDAYRDALVALLGAHALPVWGWGQRDAYARLVMDGPSLDQWVRTANLWGEEERDLWEWEQMVFAVTDEAPDEIVARAIGDLGATVVGAIDTWLDLAFVSAYLDGLGEELVRTFAHSSYAPLARHAKVLTLYKRGQAADGCTALAEVVHNHQLGSEDVEEAAARWAGHTRSLAERIAELEATAGWTGFGIATPFDPHAALARVDERVRKHLEERR